MDEVEMVCCSNNKERAVAEWRIPYPRSPYLQITSTFQVTDTTNIVFSPAVLQYEPSSKALEKHWPENACCDNNLTIQSSRTDRHVKVQKLRSHVANGFRTISTEFRYNSVVFALNSQAAVHSSSRYVNTYSMHVCIIGIYWTVA
jgi:trans-aconitate methyltransferase